MILTDKLNKNIDKIYDLTNAIKSLEKKITTASPEEDVVKIKTSLVKVLLNYENIRDETIKLLDEYFLQERARTNVADFNYHLLHKRLSS